jgi:hypothetical protein
MITKTNDASAGQPVVASLWNQVLRRFVPPGLVIKGIYNIPKQLRTPITPKTTKGNLHQHYERVIQHFSLRDHFVTSHAMIRKLLKTAGVL